MVLGYEGSECRLGRFAGGGDGGTVADEGSGGNPAGPGHVRVFGGGDLVLLEVVIVWVGWWSGWGKDLGGVLVLEALEQGSELVEPDCLSLGLGVPGFEFGLSHGELGLGIPGSLKVAEGTLL